MDKKFKNNPYMRMNRAFKYANAKVLAKHKMSLSDYHTFLSCFEEYCKDGLTCTFIEPVAKVFKKYGCEVILDECNVNWSIR